MLNSSAKLSTAFLFAIAALALPPSVRLIALVMVVVLILVHPSFRPYSKKARAFVLAFAKYAITITAVVIVVNAFIVSEGDAVQHVGAVRISLTGLRSGVDIVTRLLLLSVSAVLYFGSTSVRTFALYIEQSRLPAQITAIILLSIYFVEEIPKRILTIHAAQESRGAALRGSVVARGRALITILGPLVLASMVESIERGVTLQLRGFFQRKSARGASEPTNIPSRSWTYACLVAALLTCFWGIFRG